MLQSWYSKRTKHIDIKYHFIRELFQEKNIDIKYCSSEIMVADLLTKPIEAVKIRKFVEAIGLT